MSMVSSLCAEDDDELAAVTLTVDAALYVARAVVQDLLRVPAVLALVPTVVTAEEQQRVDDAIGAELRAAGIITEHGQLHPCVAQWMTLLCSADREMTLLSIAGDTALRMVVVRAGNEHVVASRCDDDIVIQPLVTSEPFDFDDLAGVVCTVTGPPPPSLGIDPVVGEADELTADHLQTLAEAGASDRDARLIAAVGAAVPLAITEVQVIERGRGYRAGESHTARIVDTAAGRLMIAPSTQPDESSTVWATIGEASLDRIAAALADLVAMLPSGTWVDNP